MSHDWVEPYMERVMDHLGLTAWTWGLQHQTGLTVEHGTRMDKCDASCHVDWRYLNAEIMIDSQIWIDKMSEPSTAAKLLLCHEACHILLAQLGKAVEQIVNVYFPPEDETPSDKSTAMTLYSDHEEHVITRLGRQVCDTLEREDRYKTEIAAMRKELKAHNGKSRR